MPAVSPIEKVGKYVSPRDWNSLISDPDTVSAFFIIEFDLLSSLQSIAELAVDCPPLPSIIN